MSIFDQVNEGIKNAMKNKEEATLRALRGVKSALLLANFNRYNPKIIYQEEV